MKWLFLLLLLSGFYSRAQQRVFKNGLEYTCYEQMPEFPGDLQSYLKQNRRYTAAQADSGLEGRAVVRFIVCDDGTVADPHLARSSGYPGLDREALRLVQGMPRWKPGRGVNNRLVDVVYYLPVLFRID